MRLKIKSRIKLLYVWLKEGPNTLCYELVKKRIYYEEKLDEETWKKISGKEYNQHLINACIAVLNSKPRVKIRAVSMPVDTQ